TDEALLDSRRENLVAALCRNPGTEGARAGLAWLELSAGRFCVTEVDDETALAAELARLKPAELLLEEGATDAAPAVDQTALRHLPPWHFESGTAERLLCAQFGTRDLAGFGA